jgi:8-oxo-dGTP diphosphatase
VKSLQRVTNCIVVDHDQVLLLQKPRRGWWVAPGGKMEAGESILETVKREYWEETGITVKNPELKGIFSMVIFDEGKIVSEWMLFTFKATKYEGEMLKQSPEGKLEWKKKDEVLELPMAAGDKWIFKHVLHSDRLLYGTFHYTPDFELLSYRLDPEPQMKKGV